MRAHAGGKVARAAVVVAAAALLCGPWSGAASGDLFVESGGKTTVGGETDFGSSVALSADATVALVGAPADGFVGSAWVLTRSGDAWAQPGVRLTLGRGTTRYTLGFGGSVALSADGATALVGASGVRSEWGAARVFTRSTAGWTRRGVKLTPVDEAGVGDGRGGRFAISVALSADGDTALIGAPWKQMGRKLTVPLSPGEEAIGRSVALSADGTTALIGLRSMVDFKASSADAGIVLVRAGGAWRRQGAPLTAPRDRPAPVETSARAWPSPPTAEPP
jgi:hypothetical protein